ncbi:MAG: LppP/LprE family lipoprotein [Firmicutes bacterium]|nr:LppP/LprE family lipoprotein [Bacillota bacterium]
MPAMAFRRLPDARSLTAFGVGVLLALAPFAPAAASPRKPPYRGLTRSAILRVLRRAEEVTPGHPRGDGEHLALLGKIVSVPDGHGGTLTAVPAVRYPTADGYGQLVLFWVGRRLVGSNNLTPLPDLGPEAVSLAVVRAGPDRIVVRYARYRASDPMYRPSLPPGYVTYSWDGKRLVASGPVPRGAVDGLTMRLP